MGDYFDQKIHWKLSLFGPILEDNWIQFISPIVFDGPLEF